MHIKPNKERAEEVLGKLLGTYLRNEYPFNQPEATPPQILQNLPKSLDWGGREHALFLFTLCYWMRGRIKSHTATRQLTRLYGVQPEIFLPENAEQINPDLLTNDLVRFGLGFNATETGRAWKRNLIKIRDEWNGDPRLLLHGVSDYEEACNRIRNHRKQGFLGFQHKMVSMLIYFYMHAGMISAWKFPIPVDFHVLRTVFSHKIIQVEGNGNDTPNGFYSDSVRAATRTLFMDYCVEHDVDPIALCDAVWIYSGTMCNRHPGNQSLTGEKKMGRRTEVRPMPRWTNAQSRTYERTCAVCVVQGTCTICIPSADYYIKGRVGLRSKRDTPPQGIFSLLTPPTQLRPPEKEGGNQLLLLEEQDPSIQGSLFPTVEPPRQRE